jgi:phospholipase/carboxylesterase
VVSARAPIPMQPFGNAWYAINFEADGGKFSNIEQAVESRKSVMQFIAELEKNYPVQKSGHTLFGFSQGSILSYALSLSHPEKFKQIVAMSGYIDEKMLVENYREQDFSHLRIFGSHGTQDQVIPVDWARKNQPFLNDLNIENDYSEYPVGHGISPAGFQKLLKWLS